MPLLDHFHPPLSDRRKWHAFHHAWATVLAFEMNRQLPKGFFAEPNVQFGIEIDVAAFDEEKAEGTQESWVPPAPTQVLPMAVVTDIVEVAVYSSEAGPVLAGAIEIVSPANKDRPAHRDAFVSKCAALVQNGIGLVVVDVVTERQADLHDELLRRLTAAGAASHAPLWVASYRAVTKNDESEVEIWHQSLSLGAVLPTLPFWLKNGPCFSLDLEVAYTRTCRELAILGNGIKET
jgi:Protein of unknown function (DUF4058)